MLSMDPKTLLLRIASVCTDKYYVVCQQHMYSPDQEPSDVGEGTRPIYPGETIIIVMIIRNCRGDSGIR